MIRGAYLEFKLCIFIYDPSNINWIFPPVYFFSLVYIKIHTGFRLQICTYIGTLLHTRRVVLYGGGDLTLPSVATRGKKEFPGNVDVMPR